MARAKLKYITHFTENTLITIDEGLTVDEKSYKEIANDLFKEEYGKVEYTYIIIPIGSPGETKYTIFKILPS